MKYRIKISQSNFEELRQLVTKDHPREGAAFALAGASAQKDTLDVIVRRSVPIPKELFSIQEENHLELAPQAINGLISLCEKNKLGAILCHSHPADIPYSPSDDHGEKRIFEVLRKFIPKNAPTASLLFYPGGVRGRIWLPDQSRPISVLQIRIIGQVMQNIPFDAPSKKPSFDPDLYDRQIMAFGEAGQALINSTKVGVVGVGGTGSPVAEQLIRLGVQDLLLIDKDRFDKSNLTRVYGTFASDMPKKWCEFSLPFKANLVAAHLRRINPKANIHALTKDVVTQNAASALLDRDIIFLCTDNHWSRSVVNQIAYQYFIPTINMGVRIDATEKTIIGATGVVDVLQPDLPCLWCSQSLRGERIAAESIPPEERRERIREGYVESIGTNAPSIVSLTTTVAGLSVTAFLQILTGFMGEFGQVQRLNYRILEGVVSRGSTPRLNKCICDKVRGCGDLQKLNTSS